MATARASWALRVGVGTPPIGWRGRNRARAGEPPGCGRKTEKQLTAVPCLIVSAALTPVAATGFNQDLVVEVGAPTGASVAANVTATMDNGTATNTSGSRFGGTYYQTGYVTASPTTGLPSGTTVVSATGQGT